MNSTNVLAAKVLMKGIERSFLARDNKKLGQIVDSCIEEAKYANITREDLLVVSTMSFQKILNSEE